MGALAYIGVGMCELEFGWLLVALALFGAAVLLLLPLGLLGSRWSRIRRAQLVLLALNGGLGALLLPGSVLAFLAVDWECFGEHAQRWSLKDLDPLAAAPYLGGVLVAGLLAAMALESLGHALHASEAGGPVYRRLSVPSRR